MKIIFTLAMVILSVSSSAQVKLSKPEAKMATNITSDGFTANWGAVRDAEAYCVYVYDKEIVKEDGEVAIVDEDFLGVSIGSIYEPKGGDEDYVDLSESGFADTFGWSAYASPMYASGMIDGLIYSPYLNLCNNDGKYSIIITSYSTSGDVLRVETHGKNGPQTHIIKTHVERGIGLSEDTLELIDGCKDLFFTVVNTTAEVGVADFIDRIKVIQELKAGDVVDRMVACNEAVESETEYGDSITSCRFRGLSKYTDSTVLYYDVYASANDFSTPNGPTPYTYVCSEYSDMVMVNLPERKTEFVTEGIDSHAVDAADGAMYTLSGQKVGDGYKGMVIKKGRKILLR